MLTLNIFFATDLVGIAELEHFDDGMGVAHGCFRPAAAYENLRSEIVRAADSRSRGVFSAGPVLTAKTLDGEDVDAGFVTIDDFVDVSVEPEISVQFASRTQSDRLLARRI